MFIERIAVKNFRSILAEELYCDDLTALVGANGTGKSSFLRALELFYATSPKIDSEDFYDSDTTQDIIIAITYTSLSKEAKNRFSKYDQGGKLTVERVFKWNDGKVQITFHGSSLQNPTFEKIREGLLIKDRGATAKGEYNKVRELKDYSSLPAWTKIADVEQNLATWESKNPDKCSYARDDGRFFGFNEVGQGYLGRFTRFLYIPAVREASDDASEGRGSALTDLMDMVVRSVLAGKEEIQKLQEETQEKYEEMVKPENLKELGALAGDLSKTLQSFVPSASVDLKWLPADPIKIDLPKADIKLVEDKYPTAVHRTGPGLQRAFIMTMLQHLALVRSSVEAEKDKAGETAGDVSQEKDRVGNILPNLMLAIEEPELYQHPNRQRHLSNVFLELAKGSTPGVADKTQIIYSTHSPLFVGLDRFNQIRLLRKVDNGSTRPRVTNVVGTTLDTVANNLWVLDGKKGEPYSGETLRSRLHAIMTPIVNEGFFADKVVLVEGSDDHAAIMGMAKAMGIEIESTGITVVPVCGKRSLDRPALIFKEFGIPVYILWDADGGKGETAGICEKCGKVLDGRPDPLDNHRLLKIVGEKGEDWPSCQGPNFCCFKTDLETTMCEEIGKEVYEEIVSECQKEFEISKRKHAIKNPYVISAIIHKAKEKGKMSPTLEKIVKSIRDL